MKCARRGNKHVCVAEEKLYIATVCEKRAQEKIRRKKIARSMFVENSQVAARVFRNREEKVKRKERRVRRRRNYEQL